MSKQNRISIADTININEIKPYQTLVIEETNSQTSISSNPGNDGFELEKKSLNSISSH
jgi:hypothetical protein